MRLTMPALVLDPTDVDSPDKGPIENDLLTQRSSIFTVISIRSEALENAKDAYYAGGLLILEESQILPIDSLTCLQYA